jgi:nitric oxide reductase NorD protein
VGELELLACAVAGRSVPLERSRTGVHTDGTTIFVGADLEPGAEHTRQAVMTQAALIASGSLDPTRMHRLARSTPTTARRYLGLEVVRACNQLDAILPARLQSAVAAYAGLVGVTASADESLRRALGAGRLEDPPPWFGQLHPLAVSRASTSAKGGRATDAEIAEAIRKAMESSEPEDDDGDEGDRSRILELMSSPLKNPLGTALLRMLGTKRSAGDGVGGMEISVVEHRSGTASGSARPARADATSWVKVGRQLVRGATYPEWDHRKGQYREDWCVVGEFEPPLDPDVSVPPATAEPMLTRELSRLGLTWRPHNGETFGDELDLSALVEHRASLAAGMAGEPRVYRAERRTAQELGVLVLLDATGSTAEQHDGKSAFEEQRSLALGLTTTLDQLGVRVATYAFYSRGRGNVRFLRCKTFEERWGVRAQRRLFSISPTGFTRFGAAIRHGTHLLDTQAGTQRRLMVVLGDGIAYDDGYEGRYAIEDSRRAIHDARDRAVACVGLSTHPSAESIWPAEAHRITATPAELAGEVRDLFGGALRRAGRGS